MKFTNVLLINRSFLIPLFAAELFDHLYFLWISQDKEITGKQVLNILSFKRIPFRIIMNISYIFFFWKHYCYRFIFFFTSWSLQLKPSIFINPIKFFSQRLDRFFYPESVEQFLFLYLKDEHPLLTRTVRRAILCHLFQQTNHRFCHINLHL